MVRAHSYMKVIHDKKKQPQGVFIPLADWKGLKDGIDSSNDLYKVMEELTQKSVFEMTPEELTAKLAPMTEKVIADALNNGLYISYPAGFLGKPNQFIHENIKGVKQLIEIDVQTGEERLLKNL